MDKYRHILVLCFFIFSIIGSYAQIANSNLVIRGKYTESGTVKLRWVPKDIKTWYKGLQYGYEVRRMSFSDTSGIKYGITEMANSRVLLSGNVKNLDSLVWKHLLNVDSLSNYDKLAAGAMFSNNFNITITDSTSFTVIKQAQTDKENRFKMALFAAEFDYNTALKSGLAFEDSTIEANITYYYYVKLLDPDTSNISEPAIGLIKAETKELPKNKIIYAGGSEHAIILIWEGDNNEFISYQVGRLDSANNIVILNDLPIMGDTPDKNNPNQRSYADSVSLLNTPYYYVVRGIDNFGVLGPWSDTLSGISKEAPVQIAPHIDSVNVINNNSIQVEWSYDSTLINRIIGFGIMRSNSASGPFTQMHFGLLSTSTFEFTDTHPGETNYYIVIAVDEDSNQLKSYPVMGQLIDSIPPDAPATPIGTISKTGKVNISWSANTENDIKGYRVYACNNQDGEYTQVTVDLVPTNKYTYQLDINNLQKKTYVKIRAYDKRGNHSEFSGNCELAIPDVVPPQPPNIISVEPEASKITVKWIGPTVDVNNYVINRRVKGTTAWLEIGSVTSIGTQPFTYIDSNVLDTKIYEYSISAEDAAGNNSYSKKVSGVPLKPEREEVSSITITTISGGSGIFVWWVYPDLENVKGFKVFRQKASLPFKCVETMNKGDLEYIGGSCPLDLDGGKAYRYHDDKFTKGNTYKFKVIAIYDDGTQSPLGAEASVNITN